MDGMIDMDLYFPKLSEKSIKSTLTICKVTSKANATKDELIESLKRAITEESFQWMKLNLDTDGKISTGLSCKDTELIDTLTKIGSVKASLEKFSKELLNLLLKNCDLDEDITSETTKEEMVSKIEDEVLMQGLFKILNKLDSASLESYCQDLGVEYDDEKKPIVIDNILNAICGLSSDDQEQEKPEKVVPKKPATTKSKKGSAKKPATTTTAPPVANSKKPAAKKPATTTTTTKPASANGNGHTNGKFNEDLPLVSDKRVRKPMQPTPPPVKKPAAKKAATTTTTTTSRQGTKRKLEPVESDEEEEEEEVSEDEMNVDDIKDRKKGITGRNEAGGYYKDGKYISPSISYIKKGITKEQINDWYNLDDIREYCKLNNLPQSLTKSKLIKNIIDSLKGTYKPKMTMKEKNEKKKKQKEEREKAKKLKLEEKEKETTSS